MAFKELQQSKLVTVVQPTAIVDNTSWTTAEVDTRGFNYATFIFQLGASDIAMAALSLTESDVTASGHATIAGADFASATDIDGNATALPSATDDGKILVVQLDLRKRKRFIDVVATAGNGAAGTYLSALCILDGAEEGYVASAGMGAEHVVRV